MNAAPRRILLVSGASAELTEVVHEAATDVGLEVKLTSSAGEFKSAFVPFDPSVVALDLQLTDMPWYELLYWISETVRPPKLLLLSADDEVLRMAVTLARAWQLSLIAALPKPVPRAELQKVLAAETA